MIEFCTVRRMVVTIILLGIVTIISVVIETKYEPANKHIKGSAKSNSEKVAAAKNTDNVSVADIDACPTSPSKPSDCKLCTKWELEKETKVCDETGYIAKVTCLDSNTSYISCEPPLHIKQRSFWIHEAIWLVIGIISYIFVHFRRNALDQKLLDRVNKQIASGV